MDWNRRARQVGWTAVACAVILRLYLAGAFSAAADWVGAHTDFLLYLETGRRLSSREAEFVFLPESPAPAVPPETAPAEPPQAGATLPETSEETLPEITYACDLRPDIPALLEEKAVFSLRQEKPTVLILHTHTTESYTKSREPYEESSDYRTLDENYNMLSIGAEVARQLEAGGIRVIQDRQLHDYPSYNGSYTHARKAIQSLLSENPAIQLILDLHRDAADTPSGQLRTVAEVDGARSAQLMLVVGSNASGRKHPDWERNLALALQLQTRLELCAPGITRPTVLRGQRFNQDLSTGALLVEVGAAGNTHAEALRAADVLAEAILSLADGNVS